AAQTPGVLAVITHENAPKLQAPAKETMRGEDRLPLQDNIVHHDGQHIGMVIADTFEHATMAAALVKVDYDAAAPAAALERALDQGFYPKTAISGADLQVKRGDVAAALRASAVRVSQRYS